jgi:L-iditol 2-dehydrogenase
MLTQRQLAPRKRTFDLDVERLFTHRWRLEQAEEAYRLFDTQTTGKAVILPS